MITLTIRETRSRNLDGVRIRFCQGLVTGLPYGPFRAKGFFMSDVVRDLKYLVRKARKEHVEYKDNWNRFNDKRLAGR